MDFLRDQDVVGLAREKQAHHEHIQDPTDEAPSDHVGPEQMANIEQEDIMTVTGGFLAKGMVPLFKSRVAANPLATLNPRWASDPLVHTCYIISRKVQKSITPILKPF